MSSLHSRTPLVLHGGDTVMRLMWFYMMFLPTEHCFSVDNCGFYIYVDYKVHVHGCVLIMLNHSLV